MMDLGSVKAEKASGVQGRPSGCLEEGSNWNLHTLAVQMFLYEITSWKCLKNGLAAVGIKTLSQALPHILPFEICSLFPAFTEMLKQHRAASMFLYSIQHYNSYYRQCLNILLILKAKFAQLCRILPCITPTQSLQLYPHQAPHALPPSSPEPQITTQGSTGTSRQLLCSPPISCRRAAHSHPCPHHSSFPLFSKIFPLHLLATLFPGGALLDWLGFNCSAQPGSEWNFTFASSSCSLELPQFLWISEKYPLVIHRICPFVPHGVTHSVGQMICIYPHCLFSAIFQRSVLLSSCPSLWEELIAVMTWPVTSSSFHNGHMPCSTGVPTDAPLHSILVVQKGFSQRCHFPPIHTTFLLFSVCCSTDKKGPLHPCT